MRWLRRTPPPPPEVLLVITVRGEDPRAVRVSPGDSVKINANLHVGGALPGGIEAQLDVTVPVEIEVQ